MKERPILFSAPMVSAILDGRKTQTRRVCKGQRELSNNHDFQLDRCPFGKSGDRLWVRETWQGPLFYDEIPEDWNSDKYKTPEYCHYKASDSCDFTDADDNFVERWSPSIHMPRWASRILLEVVNVRVERLQDISEDDAIAEGLKAITKDGRTIKYGIPDLDRYPGNDNHGWQWCDWNVSPVIAYKRLWESINGPESWDLNPWVWVVEFKLLEAVK
ncbi:MAG: hypothetical protein K2Q45_04095 [Nitrosomonas sp.]|nr:hypothetical protein [Nitrosomonas sp.]